MNLYNSQQLRITVHLLKTQARSNKNISNAIQKVTCPQIKNNCNNIRQCGGRQKLYLNRIIIFYIKNNKSNR